jgi:hypothetical protein
MPKYTLIHGGLKVEGGFKSQGDEVELSVDEAEKLKAELGELSNQLTNYLSMD